MTGITFSIPEEKRDVDLHDFLIKNAKILGKPIYYSNKEGDFCIRVYELNEIGIFVKQDPYGMTYEGIITGSSKGVKGLVNLLKLKDFVKV